MSLTTDLLAAVSGLLADAGICVVNDGTPYAPTDTGLALLAEPAAPDRVIVLSDYPIVDDPHLPYAQIGVQIRCRGLPQQPADAMSLRDSVYEVLQAAVGITSGTVHIGQFLRHSSLPLGMDDAERYAYSDNYYADVDLPATSNRPG